MDLKGKGILITGGSSGIGKGVALRFAQSGARLFISATAGLDAASSRRGRDEETRAGLGEPESHTLADAAAPTGDKDTLPLQSIGRPPLLVVGHPFHIV